MYTTAKKKRTLATPYLRSQTDRMYKIYAIAYTCFWMTMAALVGYA